MYRTDVNYNESFFKTAAKEKPAAFAGMLTYKIEYKYLEGFLTVTFEMIAYQSRQ